MEEVSKILFPIAPETSETLVFTTIGEWLVGNRHFNLGFKEDTVLEKLVNEREVDIEGKSKVVIKKIAARDRSTDYFGFSFIHPGEENGDFWRTKLAMKRSGDKTSSQISIAVEHNASTCFDRGRRINKPTLVNHLIEKLPRAFDSWIPLKDMPHELEVDDDVAVAGLINGQSPDYLGHMLPVVLMTRDRANQTGVDPSTLAKKLSGIAHVFLEPDNSFSRRLVKMLNNQDMNCYNGTVRIYWPQIINPALNRLWTKEELQRSGEFKPQKDPYQAVATYILSRTRGRSLGSCDYRFIEAVKRRTEITETLDKMKNQLQSTREKSEAEQKEHNQLVELYEGTITELTSERDHYKKQTERLSDDNAILNDELEVARTNLRQVQSYQEPTEDIPEAQLPEILILLNKLLKENSNMPLFQRAKIEQLLKVKKNILDKAVRMQEQALEELANGFAGYTRMGSHQNSILSKYGFTYTDEGKHYKIYKIGANPDICVTLSKTPGDCRVGRHFISDLKSVFFLQ